MANDQTAAFENPRPVCVYGSPHACDGPVGQPGGGVADQDFSLGMAAHHAGRHGESAEFR